MHETNIQFIPTCLDFRTYSRRSTQHVVSIPGDFAVFFTFFFIFLTKDNYQKQPPSVCGRQASLKIEVYYLLISELEMLSAVKKEGTICFKIIRCWAFDHQFCLPFTTVGACDIYSRTFNSGSSRLFPHFRSISLEVKRNEK